MLPDHEVLVPGSPTTGRGGHLRFANLTLVTTDEGHLLFDTGHMLNRADLLRALAARGLAPGDIDRVFLSHVHFDHVDNIDLFPNATVYVSRDELAYSGDPARDDTLVPWMIAEQLAGYRLEILDRQADIGWGLTALELPGHTPGSMGLRFQGVAGTVILAGDALADPAAVDCRGRGSGRRPPAFDNGDRLRDSACRVLAEADIVVPGHFAQLRRAGSGEFVAVPRGIGSPE